MPVYEYKCYKEKCGHEQERIFRMSEKPQEFEDICDKCGTLTLLKAILSPSLITGFQNVQGGDRVN